MYKILINISDNYNEICLNILKNIIDDYNINIIVDDYNIDIYINNILINSLNYSFNNLYNLIIKYLKKNIIIQIYNTNFNNLIQLINFDFYNINNNNIDNSIINDNFIDKLNINFIYFINYPIINNNDFINNNKNDKFFKYIIRLLYDVKFYITNYKCDVDFINKFGFQLFKNIKNICIYN